MGTTPGLDHRLERLATGLAARLFRGRIHPVELGKLVTDEAERQLEEIPGGWRSPNDFEITMGGEPVDREILDAVEIELAAHLDDVALDRGWRLDGPPVVKLAIDPGLRPAEVQVLGEVVAGPGRVWAHLRPIDRSEPSLEVAVNRALIGRSSACDIRLFHDDVSRAHAVIWQESGSAWIGDLDSSNGTFLNGEQVHGPSAIVDGDLIAIARNEFVVVNP